MARHRMCSSYKICFYSKWSKISNNFRFLFLNLLLVFMAGIHEMLVIIASDTGLLCLFKLIW